MSDPTGTKPPNPNNDLYISVDIEADGPYPGDYSMLSLGAKALGIDGAAGEFYVEMRPISENFVPEALAVCEQGGLDREALIRSGVPANQAMTRFRNWLADLAQKTGKRPVFCSFSTWDWAYVYWYFMKYLDKSPMGHSSLDMKSLYLGKYGGTWPETGKKGIKKHHPELLAGAGRHTHNALDDAKEQAILLERMLRA